MEVLRDVSKKMENSKFFTERSFVFILKLNFYSYLRDFLYKYTLKKCK